MTIGYTVRQPLGSPTCQWAGIPPKTATDALLTSYTVKPLVYGSVGRFGMGSAEKGA